MTRLYHYGQVAFSAPPNPDALPGRDHGIAHYVWNPDDGYVMPLTMLEHLGAGLWLQSPFGATVPFTFYHDRRRPKSGQYRFEQSSFGNGYPTHADLVDIGAECAVRSIPLIAYIGVPRCDMDPYHWGDRYYSPQHAAPEFFTKTLKPYVDAGCAGIGFDSSNRPLKTGGVWPIFDWVRSQGIDPIIETQPSKYSGARFDGFSAVADVRWWRAAARHKATFGALGKPLIMADEVTARGGTAYHGVWLPPPEPERRLRLPKWLPRPAQSYWWRYRTATKLLEQGRTVVVDLRTLANAGYDVGRLGRLAA